MKKGFHNLAIVIASAAVLFTLGCGKAAINKPELAKIKTVAVVLFNVPIDIRYRKDPKDNTINLLDLVIQAAAAGSGKDAATISHRTFIEELGKEGLPFRVLTQAEMKRNAAFNRLYKAKPPQAEEKTLLGGLFKTSNDRVLPGTAPEGINGYGLANAYLDANPLVGSAEERAYILAAIRVLNVDAAMIVADPGFSFACEVCVAGAGAASTGSAYAVTIVNKNSLNVVAVRQWFATTDAQAAMVSYAVNPLQHNKLFAEHGRKMAQEFAAQFRVAMEDE